MFDIKGLRTFAMSAKDLNKAVEFYTNVLGGQITRRVEPTEEQLKAGQVKEVDVRLGNFRSPSVRRVDKTARSRPSSHVEYSLARARQGFKGVKRHWREHRKSPAA